MIHLRTKVVKLIEMHYCAKSHYNPIRHDGVIAPEIINFEYFDVHSLFQREEKWLIDKFKNRSCLAYFEVHM